MSAEFQLERGMQQAVDAYQRRDYAATRANCQKLLRKNSRHFNALQIMAMSLQDEGKFTAAADFFHRALAAAPLPGLARQMRLRLSACLHELGRTAAALGLLDEILADDIAHTGALTRKGSILHMCGDEQGALECFKQVVTFPRQIATDAEFNRGRAHWYILTSPALQPSAADVQQARDDLDWIEDADEVSHLLFALYNGYERLGEAALAWEFLRRANSGVWPDVAIDAVALDRDFAEVLRQLEDIAPQTPLLPNRYTPVFIAGLPRSGSTLLESILLEHPKVISRGESPRLRQAFCEVYGADLARPEQLTPTSLRRFGETLQASLFADADAGQVVIDKTPNHFIYAHLLLQIYAGVRIVNTIKPPLEACFSLYRQHFLNRGQHGYSYDLLTTVVYYRWHEKIVARLAQRFPDSVLNLDYAAMVDGESDCWPRVFEFCGLKWEPRFLEFYRSRRQVTTLSSAQVRQGLTTRYVDRAAGYGDVLHELRQLLELDIAALLRLAGQAAGRRRASVGRP